MRGKIKKILAVNVAIAMLMFAVCVLVSCANPPDQTNALQGAVPDENATAQDSLLDQSSTVKDENLSYVNEAWYSQEWEDALAELAAYADEVNSGYDVYYWYDVEQFHEEYLEHCKNYPEGEFLLANYVALCKQTMDKLASEKATVEGTNAAKSLNSN